MDILNMELTPFEIDFDSYIRQSEPSKQEKAFDYSTLTPDEAIKHIARFIANIWQIRPFGEGNTRTTAVFTIKYLNSLGFKVNNEPAGILEMLWFVQIIQT